MQWDPVTQTWIPTPSTINRPGTGVVAPVPTKPDVGYTDPEPPRDIDGNPAPGHTVIGPAPKADAPPPPAGPGAGSGVPSGAGVPGDLVSPYPGSFATKFDTFNPTAYIRPPDYTATTQADIDKDPGYQFRLDQGRQSLGNTAASRGLGNDAGTYKAFMDYNQNSASQEYANVDARRFSAYNTMVTDQYTDPYKFQYQGEKDASDAGYTRENNFNLQNYTTWRNQQQDTFDKYFRRSQLGLTAIG